MEDALRAPYVLLLRAKGVSERGILWRHALRNAAPPIVTVIGIQFGVLLGGAIVIETLFSFRARAACSSPRSARATTSSCRAPCS